MRDPYGYLQDDYLLHMIIAGMKIQVGHLDSFLDNLGQLTYLTLWYEDGLETVCTHAKNCKSDSTLAE